MEYRRQVGIPYDRRFKAGTSMPPTNLTIVPTYRCNLDCVMCRQRHAAKSYAADRPWYDPARELPIETWIELLDQVAGFHPYIYITGGEPLLYPHFKDLVHEATQRKLVVQVQTNGTMLAKLADFIVSEGVQLVNMSLDGPPDVHDEIRRHKGAFSRLEEGTRTLHEARARRRCAGPVISFNFTISKGNIEHLEEAVDTAIRLKADFLQIQHTMFNSPELVDRHNRIFSTEYIERNGLRMVLPSIGQGSYYQSEITGEDVPVLIDALNRARSKAKGRISLHCMPRLPDDLVAPYYLDLQYPFVERCNMFWKTMRVAPDGSVTPCLNMVVGNIREQGFSAIWNGPVMQQTRRLFSAKLFPGCVRCCQRHFTAASLTF
jgi:MoaA/NifB/PqqE/SkfB family radical SAM enzyme